MEYTLNDQNMNQNWCFPSIPIQQEQIARWLEDQKG